MKNANVANIINPSGRAVPNQFVIRVFNHVVFQSYESTIIEIDLTAHIIGIGKNWNYSRTTGRYRNQFLSEHGFNGMNTKAGLEKALKRGYAYKNGIKYAVMLL